jgi:S-adenosylmethionine:tRNA ribosyltransferase-isomerase
LEDFMSHQWNVSDFDYQLEQGLIAQVPSDRRDDSRMMVLTREQDDIKHALFKDLLNHLTPNDLLVFNNTKVFPARLFGRKTSGGRIECLVERILSDRRVLAHVRASKSPKEGTQLIFNHEVTATVLGRDNDLFELEFEVSRVLDFLNQHGLLPLPPYIDREPDKNDYDRYQTVFAKHTGAVAAPTASLHFDDAMLTAIKEQGVECAELTLHVGAGTFQPVRVENLDQHHMHSEWIDVPASLCDKINAAKARQGRVIAVGTTVLRALESASQTGVLNPFQGETDIFIYPGFEFQCVDALLTNFHLPKSTLLMLVSAFAGFELTKSAYQAAIDERYRFFSYGDCMFIQ